MFQYRYVKNNINGIESLKRPKTAVLKVNLTLQSLVDIDGEYGS